jgi:hypothetical protein
MLSYSANPISKEYMEHSCLKPTPEASNCFVLPSPLQLHSTIKLTLQCQCYDFGKELSGIHLDLSIQIILESRMTTQQ